MTIRSRVAVLRTQPETVLHDYARLFELGGGAQALAPNVTTILKDNISWHFPMPAANTTPWQLEGTIRALRQAGFSNLVCVQNQTVVTNAFKGEDLNGYVPIFRRYAVPALYNFRRQEQDYIYWPLQFKRVYEAWRETTTWGQLFQRYQREGYLHKTRETDTIQS